ncbi:MAG: GFA family protein [Betaproteobacteria bacterium]|nr:GFA family protein [Betaproteobacteria bacterium]
MLYKGACHCGRNKFEVEGVIDEIVACNCSICHTSGFLHWVIDPKQLKMITPMEELSAYIWGTGVARHYFCRTCSIAPLRKPRMFAGKMSVNVRCLEGVDASKVARIHNGKAHPV